MRTTDKGDIGVAYATADLIRRGWGVFVPVSSAAAFDLLAGRDGVYLRIQVKYRQTKNSRIEVSLRRATLGGRDRPTTRFNDEVDVVCVYCPDVKECFYLRPKATSTIRMSPTRNGQKQGIVMSGDCRQFPPT